MPTVEFLAGLVSGAISTVVTHPFDTVKVKMQVTTGRAAYKGMLHCAVDIVRTEGVLALYSGMVPPLLARPFVQAAGFGIMGELRSLMNVSVQDGSLKHVCTVSLAGGLTGVSLAALMSPVELVKIKLQEQGRSAQAGNPTNEASPGSSTSTNTTHNGNASSSAKASQRQYSTWWSKASSSSPNRLLGSAPSAPSSFVGSSPQTAATVLQNASKQLRPFSSGPAAELSEPPYAGTADCAKRIFAQHGVRGLFQGMWSTCLRNGLGWASFFVVSDICKLRFQPEGGAQPAGARVASAAAQPPPVNPPPVEATQSTWKDALRKAKSLLVKPKPSIDNEVIVTSGGQLVVEFVKHPAVPGLATLPEAPPARFGITTLLVSGGLAGLASCMIAMPADLIKSRMQVQSFAAPKYTSIMDCARQSWVEGGWRVFYKGLYPAVLRNVIGSAAVLLAYEETLHLLHRFDA
ncbi:solute carrier family 25 [Capsaspora owczarzaki ATCC 30864]|uniref:Solute carrier family 25 n=1 Tax=Capsaspora owczarzaki (strain ATCC 30864) TaxID=595528 RepID=A0A0D2VPG9_CAPO3|nr:solute carrier family 25 [Capsaspora owczarzaki ATCC 30864]KJE92377.1 solute carrier family 25 [Capsaspora owczarzaki ATCC 30864]|eukprot:XP_004364196.1 solute carrier family 25 [Capsaspora owczarzaki ATCC 30864]